MYTEMILVLGSHWPSTFSCQVITNSDVLQDILTSIEELPTPPLSSPLPDKTQSYSGTLESSRMLYDTDWRVSGATRK